MERQTLRTLTDGVVERTLVVVGSRVQAGDTLVALAANASERAQAASVTALALQEQRRVDLAILLSMRFDSAARRSPVVTLLLPQSQAVARAASVEWKQGSVPVMRAERARDRLAQLMQRGFAVPAELEAAEFDVARAQEDRALALERRRTDWAVELASTGQQIAELQRDVAARRSERTAHYVMTPVAGTVEEIMPLTAGSIVRAGDAMATISPDAALIADALVAPRDVAYLRVGMPARLIVEGYDVQEWGAADAVVMSVAHDYTLANGHPVFRARVRPLYPQLRRANGTTTQLGKGLQCQVRFLLGRKRVVALLWQRANEWLEPMPSGKR